MKRIPRRIFTVEMWAVFLFMLIGHGKWELSLWVRWQLVYLLQAGFDSLLPDDSSIGQSVCHFSMS